MSQEFWAIRHKPSMTFMPARPDGRRSRGWSFWTPRVPPSPAEQRCAPRLFETKRAAKNALTLWLQGWWVRQPQTEGDWETGYHTVAGDPAPEQPDVPRHPSEMEVVQVQLTVRA
jgi:hypothetical protein